MHNFGFGSIPVTALLVYLFQLVPVIFTYLRADCPCNVKMFLGLTSLRLLTRSGRVGSRVKNPDPVPSLNYCSCRLYFQQFCKRLCRHYAEVFMACSILCIVLLLSVLVTSSAAWTVFIFIYLRTWKYSVKAIGTYSMDEAKVASWQLLSEVHRSLFQIVQITLVFLGGGKVSGKT